MPILLVSSIGIIKNTASNIELIDVKILDFKFLNKKLDYKNEILHAHENENSRYKNNGVSTEYT